MSTETQTPRRPAGRGFGPGRGLGRGGEKPKNIKKALSDLLKYVKGKLQVQVSHPDKPVSACCN